MQPSGRVTQRCVAFGNRIKCSISSHYNINEMLQAPIHDVLSHVTHSAHAMRRPFRATSLSIKSSGTS